MESLEEIRWKLYQYKSKKMLILGLKTGLIAPYDDELIEKLRDIYEGGIPASIILLSDSLSNRHCYDRSILLAKAFLEGPDDVKLVYATIDSLKLNPNYNKNKDSSADHCFVERITKKGKHLIYDTSSGFVYDKNIYWLMEHPKVRKVNDKRSIIEYVKAEYNEDLEEDKNYAPPIIPSIEAVYGKNNEMYSHEGVELLQREVENYKRKINYENLQQEINKDMKVKGLKKALPNY